MANLVCYLGLFGAGKSYAMVSRAIQLADKDRLIIVSNVWFDIAFYNRYCLDMGYKWALKCRLLYVDLFTGNIVDMRSRWRMGVAATIDTLISYPNSVVLFDECGIHLNARFWKNTGKQFLSSLFQLRHDNITLLCGFQFWEQVDKQLREVLQLIVSCSSVAPRDKHGRPRMQVAFRHYYEPLRFQKVMFENPSAIRRWMWALKVDYNYFAISAFVYYLKYRKPHPQRFIFNIYDSFVPSKRKPFRPYLVWDDSFKTGFF